MSQYTSITFHFEPNRLTAGGSRPHVDVEIFYEPDDDGFYKKPPSHAMIEIFVNNEMPNAFGEEQLPHIARSIYSAVLGINGVFNATVTIKIQWHTVTVGDTG